MPLFMMGGIGYFVLAQTNNLQHIKDAANAAISGSSGFLYSGAGSALLRDLNGDGIADIIAPIRNIPKTNVYSLAAFDGQTGKQLWKSPTFGNHDDSRGGAAALHGDYVVQPDSRGNISAFSVKDGTQLWKISMGEMLDELCADTDTSLALKLKDKKWKSLNLADGKLTSLSGKPDACAAVLEHKKHGQTNLAFGDRTWNTGPRIPRKIDSIKFSSSVALIPRDGTVIALGHKTPGTRVPMVAQLRLDSPEEAPKGKRRRKKKAKHQFTVDWQSELPAQDPLSVQEGAPKYAALDKSHVALVYERTGGGRPHVVCFSREGGQRLWDVALPKSTTYPFQAVDVTEHHVLVTQWGRLDVFDVHSGALQFSLGQ